MAFGAASVRCDTTGKTGLMTSRFADLRPCRDATLDDLDPAQIKLYREELGQRQPVSSLLRKSDEELLVKVGCAVKVQGGHQPTLTGVLFFGRDPQRFYPSFTITFLHFAGTSAAEVDPNGPLYLDNREFRGTLPAMLDAARATIFDNLGKQARMNGFVRQDIADYPELAYREALVNAIGHRDYGLEGRSVQVRLFTDRLEVQSPGGLGGELTVENMVYEQYTRNPHIMRLLEQHGYVEQRGLGVDRMIHAMSGANLPPPSFEDRGTSFWVTLQAGTAALPLADLARMGLNDRQARAMQYLHAHGRITNRQYQTEFGVSERTALYDLQGLVDAGLALPLSSGRGRHYILRD
jgi:ATP-dependent DNA helicase RecG